MGRLGANRRWRCKTCGETTLAPELLEAPSPFRPYDTLTGCPACRCCEGFDLLCDEPECGREASCGWPTGNDADAWGGYRQTCYEHSTFRSA